VKASIAVISFILSNATKYSVDAESLCNELQQLGLPKGRHTHTHSRCTIKAHVFFIRALLNSDF